MARIVYPPPAPRADRTLVAVPQFPFHITGCGRIRFRGRKMRSYFLVKAAATSARRVLKSVLRISVSQLGRPSAIPRSLFARPGSGRGASHAAEEVRTSRLAEHAGQTRCEFGPRVAQGAAFAHTPMFLFGHPRVPIRRWSHRYECSSPRLFRHNRGFGLRVRRFNRPVNFGGSYWRRSCGACRLAASISTSIATVVRMRW